MGIIHFASLHAATAKLAKKDGSAEDCSDPFLIVLKSKITCTTYGVCIYTMMNKLKTSINCSSAL